MMLLPKERKTFFRNWLGLLAFANDKYGIAEGFGHPKSPVGLDFELVIKIKKKIWENTRVIDEYIDSVWDMPKDNIQLLKGWKNKVEGPFTILKHLKNHSIFIDDKNDILYGVIGISNPISELISAERLPIMVETVLLPFENRIIYDSVFEVYNIHYGPNIRRSYKEKYSEIKEKKGIKTAMEYSL
jgi:hypothetical protein